MTSLLATYLLLQLDPSVWITRNGLPLTVLFARLFHAFRRMTIGFPQCLHTFSEYVVIFGLSKTLLTKQCSQDMVGMSCKIMHSTLLFPVERCCTRENSDPSRCLRIERDFFVKNVRA